MTVDAYLETIAEPRRSDLETIHKWISNAMPHLACVVAPPVIGYGPYRFHYASGRQGSWYRIAVANRRTGISIRVMAKDARGNLVERFKDRFPKARVGKGAIAFRRAGDLDWDVMAELLRCAEEMGYPFAVS